MVTAINDDMFTADVIRDPYTYFGQLREEDPIHWNEKYELWVVTSYEDVIWITRRPELFSSEVFKRDDRPPYPAIDESDLGLYETFREYQAQRFIQHDQPDHTEMRKVVHGYFNPTQIERWRPLVKSAIKYLLDEAEAKGSMDVMADFATPLPVLVIAHIIGIPEEDRPFIRQWAHKLLYTGRSEADRMRLITEGITELFEYLGPQVEKRMDHPTDDLLTVLLEGEKKGVYDREQVMGNAALLLQAGHETTINLLCNGTLAFIQNPDQWDILREDPAGRTVRATEECLRYDSPVKSIQRIAAEDVELKGKTIRKGDRMRWFINSANRDPKMFAEPDTMDITRHPNRHVAFGSGIHHCLGANLARMEGQEAFQAVTERFSSMRLTAPEDELQYQPSITFRSLMSLPVTWD